MSEQSKNPYLILGIDKHCSKEEVRKAYLLQCRVHHPDMGGDEDTFKLIVWAYELLIDEVKRKKYDQFGILEHFSKEQILSMAQDNIIGLFKSIVDSIEFNRSAGRIDVMYYAEEKVKQNMSGANQHLGELRKKKTNISIAVRRIRRKKKSDANFVVKALESEKQEIRRAISNVKMDLKIIKKMIQILRDFEYITEDELNSTENPSNEFGLVRGDLRI